jgi:hypothetical protein
MSFANLRSATVAFAFFAAAALGATAQTAPIKPGLWQVQSEREVNGQKAPDMSDRMKNMSPEKRAHFEAMMKQHGIATDGSGTQKVCYTKENLDRSAWANEMMDCKAIFSSQTGSLWKWHTSCPTMKIEADGEATFPDSLNFTVKSTSVSKHDEKVRTTTHTMTGKWLSPDCGDIKPLSPKP